MTGQGGAFGCPACPSRNTTVTDSRPASARDSIRRRRACLHCGGRFTTIEVVALEGGVIVRPGLKQRPPTIQPLEAFTADLTRRLEGLAAVMVRDALRRRE